MAGLDGKLFSYSNYRSNFIATALDESIFLDVLHFPMKNIKSCDLELPFFSFVGYLVNGCRYFPNISYLDTY